MQTGGRLGGHWFLPEQGPGKEETSEGGWESQIQGGSFLFEVCPLYLNGGHEFVSVPISMASPGPRQLQIHGGYSVHQVSEVGVKG